MAATTALLDDVAAAAAVTTPDHSVDLDFNIDDGDFGVRDLDVFDFDDLAAADEFCDAYSAFVANADAKRVGGGAGGGGGWLAGLSLSGGGGGGEAGSLEGSPDSVVTTDGLLAGEEAMSAVVAELERYLMEDDAEEVFCADGDGVDERICVDDFFGDLLGGSSDDFNGIVTAAAGGALREGVDDNADDGDRVEEHICVDDFFDDDLLGSISDDFNGIVGTTSSSAGGALHDGVEDDDDGDVLAAREDEPASRKRASRHKIRGTTMPPWWGEPEVKIQVPAPWPPAAAILLCCM